MKFLLRICVCPRTYNRHVQLLIVLLNRFILSKCSFYVYTSKNVVECVEMKSLDDEMCC